MIRGTTPWRRSAQMGLVCAPVGLLVGLWIAFDAIGGGWSLFCVFAGAGAFLCGLLCWRVAAARRPGKWRGALAGGLAGALGHWVCWYFFIAVHRIAFLLGDQSVVSVGGPPMTLVEAFMGASAYSIFSLVAVGWITVPVGAAAGMILGMRQARAMEEEQQ